MSRPHIPETVARQLRQEAGFGCCVCGVPIIQYHHILEWSIEQHFRANDMMALCPLHHDQATKGAMPENEQRRFKKHPGNIIKDLAKGLMAVKQDYCGADFGSTTVVGSGTFLRVGGEDLIGFSLNEGILEISIRLYREADELLLDIQRNEWMSGNPLPWDIKADWQTLTLRQSLRNISLTLDAKKVPMQIEGRFYKNGKCVTLDKEGIRWGGKKPSGIYDLALVGLLLELEMTDSGMRLGPHPANPYGMLISWPNRRERLWKAKETWREINKTGQPLAPTGKPHYGGVEGC